jgi:secreted trypsin-like serine protease
VPLAFNGKAAKSIEVPWQVAIYDNMGGSAESLSFVCGGALITKRFILTGKVISCFRKKIIINFQLPIAFIHKQKQTKC